VTFEKGDEMDCLVRGCNFLQTSVPREAFTFRDGTPTYLDKGEHVAEGPILSLTQRAASAAVLPQVSAPALNCSWTPALQRMAMYSHTFLSTLGRASAL
jgi:Fumble